MGNFLHTARTTSFIGVDSGEKKRKTFIRWKLVYWLGFLGRFLCYDNSSKCPFGHFL